MQEKERKQVFRTFFGPKSPQNISLEVLLKGIILKLKEDEK